MRDCNKYQDMIEDYLDNLLTENDKINFEKHLKACSSCKKELEFAKSLRAALKNTEFPDVPEDFLARVNDMLDAELYPPQPPLFIRFFNRRTFSAIAACILVATFIGINHKEKLTENIAPPSATMPIVGEDNLAPSIPVPATTENENISSDTEETSLNTEEKSSDAPSSTTQDTTKTKQVTPSSNNTTKQKSNQESSTSSTSVKTTAEHSPATVSTAYDESEPSGYALPRYSEGDSSSKKSSSEQQTSNENSTLSVNSNDYMKVKQIASRYSSSKNGVYKMSSEKYSQFLNSLDNASVSYNSSVSDDGTVEFTISEK